MNSIKAIPQPRFPAVGEEALEAIRRGVRETLAEHGQAGRPIIVWRGGKAIELMPDENGKYAGEA